MGIIYCTTNKINGKMYIGKTMSSLNDRRDGHFNFAKKNINLCFSNAIRKYGIENFSWRILDNADSIKELNDLEQFYIWMFSTFPGQYNMTPGGDGGATFTGRHHTVYTKKKIAKGHIGIVVPDDVRKKMSISHTGFSHTKESKKKNSESQKKRDPSTNHRWTDDEKIAQSKRLTGIKRTPEQLEHYREGQKNRSLSTFHHPTKEEKLRKSEQMLGKNNPFYGQHHTDETKQLINSRHTRPTLGKVKMIRDDTYRYFTKEEQPIKELEGWIRQGRPSWNTGIKTSS